jgi:hypothetical protein
VVILIKVLLPKVALNGVNLIKITNVEDKELSGFTNIKTMNVIYFQPPGIKPSVCEAGMISETEPNYIWYLDEPCKILISEVKIIPKEIVEYDKKTRIYKIKK